MVLIWLGFVGAVRGPRDPPRPRGVTSPHRSSAPCDCSPPARSGRSSSRRRRASRCPAYEPFLVGVWGLGTLLWAYAVRGVAPLTLGVVLVAVWFVWQSAGLANNAFSLSSRHRRGRGRRRRHRGAPLRARHVATSRRRGVRSEPSSCSSPSSSLRCPTPGAARERPWTLWVGLGLAVVLAVARRPPGRPGRPARGRPRRAGARPHRRTGAVALRPQRHRRPRAT